MAKNYMADVAKMLGVELGHIFKIEGDSKTLYRFTSEGLVYYSEIFESWRPAGDYNLIQLLRGSMIINQPPWKPKEEEHYYYVGWYHSKEKEMFILDVLKGTFLKESALSNLNSFLQNCFKTPEEAEAQKYEIFKRLTGKDWNETYGKEGEDNV